MSETRTTPVRMWEITHHQLDAAGRRASTEPTVSTVLALSAGDAVEALRDLFAGTEMVVRLTRGVHMDMGQATCSGCGHHTAEHVSDEYVGDVCGHVLRGASVLSSCPCQGLC